MSTSSWRGAALGACLAVTVWLPSGALAGAWTQPKGEGQVITTLSAYQSDGGFDDRGMPIAGEYARIEVSPYIEYGLFEGLTIGAQPRYRWAWSGDGASQQSNQGFADIDVFVRKRLLARGNWVISAQALAAFPDAYEVSDLPTAGSGERANEARLQAGRGLTWPWPGYANVEAGYRLTDGDEADQMRIDAALGFRPWERWLFIAEALTTTSVRADSSARAYSIYRGQVLVVRDLSERFSLQVGYTHDVAGDQVGLGDAALVALWLRF